MTMHVLNFSRIYWHWTCFYFSISILIYFAEAVRITNNRLSESILHYEPVEYSRDYFISDHHRIRKSLDGNEVLKLDFKALQKTFSLRLKRDTSLFSQNLHIDGVDDFHPSNMYEGYLFQEPASFVHGFVYNGIFEGRIYSQDDKEYHIESANQYNLGNKTIHSIIYDVNDIMYEGPYQCGGVRANTSYKNQTRISWDDIQQKLNVNLHNRQRRSVKTGGRKTECHLYVRADPTYRKWANDDTKAMYLMSQHVKKVSYIFKSTDFDSNQNADGYTLHIKRIGIIDTKDCPTDTSRSFASSKPNCRFSPKNIGVEKFLDIASLDNHDQYCLSYVFAHRDFSDGVLGLAWIGDVDGAGGICDKYQSISGTPKSLNTGIVSNLNYGKVVPSRVTDVTLAHEIGHNFGSQHDPLNNKACAPGGSDGNFIMYPRATSGSEANNNKFSSCSKKSIHNVLVAKADRCFKEQGEPICGNRVVEKGEDCDCGYHSEPSCLVDKCCDGASQNGGNGGCKYTKEADQAGEYRCSPSQGFCCNKKTCKPYLNSSEVECSKRSDCAEGSKCKETSHKCPTPTFKEDFITVCNDGSNTCVKGECSGSLCSIDGRKDCQCPQETDLCNVCCQYKLHNKGSSNCTVFLDKKGKTVQKPPGSPCDQYQGYCDILNKCRKVDAEGPLSRLKKWLLNPKSFSTILDWMKSRWWACVLIGLALVLFMAGFIACCSVHTPSSNPNAPKHRTLSQTLSRRSRRNPQPSAPTPSTSSGGYPQDLPPGYDTAVRENRRLAHEYEMR